MLRKARLGAAPGRADGDGEFLGRPQLAVGCAGHLEAGGAQGAYETAFEAAEVSARHCPQQRGLDAQRQIAVRGAGLAQTPEGVARAVQTLADPGGPFAVAAAGGALGVERPADGVQFAGHGIEVFAERLLGRVRLGLAVVAFAEQVVVLEQDLADGVAAAAVVRQVVAPAAHDLVENLDLDLAEVYREGGHLK